MVAGKKSAIPQSLHWDRRQIVRGGASLLTLHALNWSRSAAARAPRRSLIDTHIHLFDPTRPQGVPYRGPENATTYVTGASAEGYSAIAAQYGVVGAIAVEASPWIEDNLWLLDAAATHEIIVGVIGNLDLTAKDFPDIFERFARNPLFRGVRSGNLWGRDPRHLITDSHVQASLATLARAQRVFETANPDMGLLQAVVRIGNAHPDLTIVIDHFLRFYPSPTEGPEYVALVRALVERPKTFVKLSGGPLPFPGSSAHAPGLEERLAQILVTWPANRLLFGSDWPNVEKAVPVGDSFLIIDTLASKQESDDFDKLCWRNSYEAYRWHSRNSCQGLLLAGE